MKRMGALASWGVTWREAMGETSSWYKKGFRARTILYPNNLHRNTVETPLLKVFMMLLDTVLGSHLDYCLPQKVGPDLLKTLPTRTILWSYNLLTAIGMSGQLMSCCSWRPSLGSLQPLNMVHSDFIMGQGDTQSSYPSLASLHHWHSRKKAFEIHKPKSVHLGTDRYC